MQTTLTSKGQLTLPKSVRDALRLKSGQRLEVKLTPDGDITLTPVKLDPLSISRVLGQPTRPMQLKDAQAVDDAIAAAVAEDWKRVNPESNRDDRD